MTVILAVEDASPLASDAPLILGSPVVTLSDGTLAVAYTRAVVAADSDVYVQRLDASGERLGAPIRVNSTLPGLQGASLPVIAALEGGGFVVSWTDQSGVNGDQDGSAIKAQVFTNAGVKVGRELQVNVVTEGEQTSPYVSALRTGGFVISWTDGSQPVTPEMDLDLKWRVYTASGQPTGGERDLVGTNTAERQTQMVTATATDGGFVGVWLDTSGALDSVGNGLVFAKFTSTGGRNSQVALVTNDSAGNVLSADVKSLPNGGFVVAWALDGDDPADNRDTDIFYRIFDASGTPVGDQRLAGGGETTTTLGAPRIIMLEDGKFIIGWSDQDAVNDVYRAAARLFAADGAPLGSQIFLGGDQQDLLLEGAVLPSGDVLFTSTQFDSVTNLTRASVLKQTVGVFEELNGTVGTDAALTGTAGRDLIAALAGADRVYGGASGDWIEGGMGNDVLSGDGADDLLFGGQGRDTLYGGEGDDLLVAAGSTGGSIDDGPDRLVGGAGRDTASYRTAVAGVAVDLTIPAAGLNEAEGDSFSGVENLDGSDFVDTLYGDGNANVLTGREGADELYGRAGADTLSGGSGGDVLYGGLGADRLIGGLGRDFAMYLQATAAVTVDLLLPSANTGEAAGDTYLEMEGVIGSAFNDVIRGGTGSDDLNGAGGDDVLEGRAGGDVLDGGAGRDTAGYFRAAGGVLADLNAPLQNAGVAAGDSFLSIENLNGSEFDDVLRGDSAANSLVGYGGDDHLVGREGNDELSGLLGGDLLDGGFGADTLRGGAGDDTLIGGTGNDVLLGGDSGDLLEGGANLDRASYAEAAAGVRASLLSPEENTGEAAGDVYQSIERLTGSGFADTLQGDGLANAIDGGGGNDVIGGRGGADTLTGGLGQDSFLFDTALGTANVDVITDFNVAADTIRLDQSEAFGALALGTLAGSAFKVGTAATEADDRIIYDPATGSIYYDPDGTGAAAQVKFADVVNGLALTNADFFVVA